MENASPQPKRQEEAPQTTTPIQTTVGTYKHRPVNWRFQLQQYGAALLVTVVLYAAFSIYLFYRRGYYDLYIANKILAGVATVLLGLVLLSGPVSRVFPRFHRYIQYRKEAGIISFFLALAHGVVSFFFLRHKFPLERFYTTGLWPFIFGLVAIIVLTLIFVVSNQRSMRTLGSKAWWFIQSWGVRAALLLTALHVGVMKYKDWVKWYQVGGAAELSHPEWPGLGLLVGWFLGFVVLTRLAAMISDELLKYSLYLLFIGLPAAIVFTFLWGIQFGL